MQKPSIYSQARDTIRSRCKDIIEYYFSSAGAEWKNGEYWTLCPYRADNSIGSFSINGKTGAWSDFSGDTETDKGDIIDLLGLVNGLGKKSREAAEMVVRDFGVCQPAQTEAANTEHEILITTPPDDCRVPEFKTEPDYTTEYVPGFVVARWDTDGGKAIRPYTYTLEGWVSKRPTGWLPLAPYDKTQPVIIVEGEKCYHAGQAAGLNVTTWHGGAQSVKRVDFSGLAGSEVVLWPDNDEPGMQAADYITEKLKAVGAAKISRVIPSPDWPKKYDIADNGEPGRVIAGARVVWPVDAEPVKLQEGFQGYTNLEKSPDAEKVDAIIDLVRERAGKPKGDISGFAHIRHLIDLDYDFRWLARYDEAKRSVVFSDEYKTIDDVYIAVLNRCADYGISISPQTRRDIVDTIVSRPENRFNSILDLLNMLESEYSENDTETLLDEWMSHFILPDNSYAHHKEIWRLWFTKTLAHLHGAFTKYDQIPADIVPVLVGGQGIGKSTLCRALAISPNEYFVDMGDKAGKELGTAESMRLISGKIVAELGEMISIRKSEIETVKSFISATADHLRQLYKEGITELPRTASFIGTSNPDQFLVDVTGNRRFFPLKIVAIDPWLTASKEGLELIKKLYAAFSRIGRGLIEQGKIAVMAACRPTRELEDWLSGARDMATDSPVIVEKIIQATHDMEQAFKDAGGFPTGPGRKQDYMKFSAVLIAQEIFGYGNESKADRNFGRWCDKVLTDMGYERSVIKIGACTQRGWKKHLDKIVIDTKRHEQEKIQEQLQHANT